MKKSLFLFAMQCFALAGFAQDVDITPSNFKYVDQPVGPVSIQKFFTGANVGVPCNKQIEGLSENGVFVVAGGQYANSAQPYAENLQAGTAIVDLGGEVGKVLCINGGGSKFNEQNQLSYPACAGVLNWFNFNWFTDAKSTPRGGNAEKPNIRVRVVMNIFANQIDEATAIVNKAYMVTNQGNILPNGDNNLSGADVTSGAFVEMYEDGEPVLDENENYIYDATKWLVYEFDTFCPQDEDGGEDASGAPLRLKMEMNPGALQNATFFIKEISFTQIADNTNPIVGARKKTYATYSVDPQSYVTAIVGTEMDKTSLENAVVYDMNGRLVADKSHLLKGAYIMKVGKQSIKFLVK